MRLARIKWIARLLLFVGCFFLEWSDFPKAAPDYFGQLGSFLPADIESSETKVKTEDGYELNLFVLKHRSKFDESLPPVLFQHGFGNFGLSWLLNGEASGPVTLCRQGFAVYLLNGRGTPFSLHHQSLDFRDARYWDFSFEDLAADVLAAADLVFGLHRKKLLFVGHSQGANLLLTGLADPRFKERLEDRLFLAHLFAPVICQRHARPPTAWDFGLLSSARFVLRSHLGYATFGSGKLSDGFLAKALEQLQNRLCGLWDGACFWAFSSTELSNRQNNLERFGSWSRYHPTSNPLKTMQHFGQVQQLAAERNCWVRRFDYGSPEQNRARYGLADPPSFDFGQVRLPVQAYFGSEDRHFSQADVEDFAALFRSQQNVQVSLLPGWGHVTFQLGLDLPEFYSELAASSAARFRSLRPSQSP